MRFRLGFVLALPRGNLSLTLLLSTSVLQVAWQALVMCCTVQGALISQPRGVHGAALSNGSFQWPQVHAKLTACWLQPREIIES